MSYDEAYERPYKSTQFKYSRPALERLREYSDGMQTCTKNPQSDMKSDLICLSNLVANVISYLEYLENGHQCACKRKNKGA